MALERPFSAGISDLLLYELAFVWESLGDSYPHDFVFRHKRYPMMTARAIARDISWSDLLSSVPPDTAPRVNDIAFPA